MNHFTYKSGSCFLVVCLGILTALCSGGAFAENYRQVTYYHTDALQSPAAASDENGNVIWRESYKPYGERLLRESQESGGVESAWDEKNWFTGKQEEYKLNIQNFGARWYDQEGGRFLSIDPVNPLDVIESNPNSFNRYIYANNNPYLYVDPDGQIPVPAAIAVGIAITYSYSQKANAPGPNDVITPDSPVDMISSISGPIGKSLGALVGLGEVVTKGAGKNVKEGIYEFTDTAGKKYCGQSCNIPNRLNQHVKSGKLDPNQSVTTTEVLGGKTAREIAEHKRIQEITGGVPARFSDKVSNKVDPIGPNRSDLLDD